MPAPADAEADDDEDAGADMSAAGPAKRGGKPTGRATKRSE